MHHKDHGAHIANVHGKVIDGHDFVEILFSLVVKLVAYISFCLTGVGKSSASR